MVRIRSLLLLGCTVLALFTYSQSWNPDSIASSIPSKATASPDDLGHYLAGSYSSDLERIRALFSWMATNISYDMNQVESMGRFETMDEFVRYTMRGKRAVCQGYAEVFTAVCNEMGIMALTVHGYNRVDGRLKTDLGHAWNIARIEGAWYLFDPTWGSGYLENGRYRKSFASFYFMTPPDSLILSHMPFDPVWQLREFPVSHDQFVEGGEKGPVYYNYSDTLNLYYSLDEVGRAEATLHRAESAHANRKEILSMYRKYRDYVANMKCNIEINRYNESSTSLRDAIDRFNEFQEIRNRRGSDRNRLTGLLEQSAGLVRQSLSQARSITPCKSLTSQEVSRLIAQIREVEHAISESFRSL